MTNGWTIYIIFGIVLKLKKVYVTLNKRNYKISLYQIKLTLFKRIAGRFSFSSVLYLK